MAAVLTFVALTSGCGRGGTAATDHRPAPTTRATDCTGAEDASIEFLSPTINELANNAHAAAEATVVTVSAPRWNATDGRDWCPDEGQQLSKRRYRDVVVRIERVLFDSAALRLEEGTDVTTRFMGTGRVEEGAIDGSPSWAHAAGSLPGATGDGPIQADQRFLVLLAWTDRFAMEDGLSPAIVVEGGVNGNWRLEGASATSVLPTRDVAADELIARLQHERRRGRVADDPVDALTRARPLG